MQTPYLLMTALFASLTLLAAAGSALASWGIMPAFSGLPWLRVHFVSIGVLLEILFGVLPRIAAERNARPQPSMRWDIWLALNGGLITLLIGIPLVSTTLLITGGALIFIAAAALIDQLTRLGAVPPTDQFRTGRIFYTTGLVYLLLGVILGTGMWLGWGEWLRIVNPKEIHVHSNLWGFTALVFAGLFIDVFPSLVGGAWAWPRSVKPIYWLMSVGALGLVLGPWVQTDLVTNAGLVLHTIGSIWLLAGAIKTLRTHCTPEPRSLHLITSYIWFFIPVVVAPLIVANAENFPVAEIAGGGGPILIYGWLLQFSFGLIPTLFARLLPGDPSEDTSGSWVSLIAVHAGAVLYWVGLFMPEQRGILQGSAFALWAISLLPALALMWARIRHNVNQAIPQRA